ncbi:helix-turn-helix transcriptional regulator [Nocardia salmonicida]|uniref:helix-turn-helix domain-containing protein n=1 Tax=Nocardia salmonicida TaxID=53431 RepID=UPI00340EFF83
MYGKWFGDTGDVALGETLKRLRDAAGLSQAQLGELCDIPQKTLSNYETGSAEPELSREIRLADALEVPLSTLAGIGPRDQDLSGRWWAGWETEKDGVSRVDVHSLQVVQDRDWLEILAERARPVEDGSYAWRGQLKVWDREAAMGWYTAADGAVRSKGTMFFMIHAHGHEMIGKWTGLSYAGWPIDGWAAMSRTQERVGPLVEHLRARGGNLNAWPTLLS